ncbi:MAG: hypothetical protein ACYCZI_12085 [Metallibacterium scheffleri]
MDRQPRNTAQPNQKRRTRTVKKKSRRASPARARETATEIVLASRYAKLFRYIAWFLDVEYDAVVSIAWMTAYGLVTRNGLRMARQKWTRTLWSAVGNCAERPSSWLPLDEEGSHDIADANTPEAMAIQLESWTIETESNSMVCASDETDDEIKDTKELAERMGISVRHARRYIARWRCQDFIRGEDY